MNVQTAGAAPSVSQVMQWLAEVSDPEIPVLSVVDLGLIRDVAFDAGTCIVTITPTYSGCPAMQLIQADIQATLQRHGVAPLRVQTSLSPAWTTDWMTPKAHAVLKSYGIAPPAEKAVNLCGIRRLRAAPLVACPRCGSTSTRLVSQFGSTACKAHYCCSECGEPFDYFKAH